LQSIRQIGAICDLLGEPLATVAVQYEALLLLRTYCCTVNGVLGIDTAE